MSNLEAARRAQLAERDAAVENPTTPPSDAPDHPVGFVLQAKTGGYLVLSRSTPGAWWLVHGKTCSCPAGRSGLERCWHRRQVAAFVAVLNEDRKRPSAPPNISALCD